VPKLPLTQRTRHYKWQSRIRRTDGPGGERQYKPDFSHPAANFQKWLPWSWYEIKPSVSHWRSGESIIEPLD
jgi:hypothetical protein